MRLHLIRLLALVGFIACAGMSMGQTITNLTGCKYGVRYYYRPIGSPSCALVAANTTFLTVGGTFTFPAPPFGNEYFAAGAVDPGFTPGFVYNQAIAPFCGPGNTTLPACGAVTTFFVISNAPFDTVLF